jgi:SAM-dependent methyltransferase
MPMVLTMIPSRAAMAKPAGGAAWRDSIGRIGYHGNAYQGGTPMTLDQQVAAHYARADLEAAVIDALQAAGKKLDRLTLDDLAPIDEFHVRGREATLELGERLALSSDLHVLDVGSGLGGPSRRLADAYGCRITGIDLTEDFCRVATMLAGGVGLHDKVVYRQGNALAMPFEDASFDAAYTQHVAMNIEDKAALYAEVRRVLKPGARFGIYDLLQGDGGDVLFPVPWARDASISFLVRPTELRALLEAAKFEISSWRDTTAQARLWVDQAMARVAEPVSPPSALPLQFGADAKPMAQNVFRNLLEGRVVPIEVICRKP